MTFVQLIEFQTSRADEMEELDKKWAEHAGDSARATRAMVVKDRDKENHYYVIIEFPSYEEAMANNDLPATQEFAAGFRKLVDGEPRYVNTDVIVEPERYHTT